MQTNLKVHPLAPYLSVIKVLALAFFGCVDCLPYVYSFYEERNRLRDFSFISLSDLYLHKWSYFVDR